MLRNEEENKTDENFDVLLSIYSDLKNDPALKMMRTGKSGHEILN
ncbi:hypothetical protein VDG1235_2168 [Verrucomicrobiia bacterium DG1235]|nr:hypothetical protein VDG1235_2168 [Verrucomicrobiae bacterium DG1235]